MIKKISFDFLKLIKNQILVNKDFSKQLKELNNKELILHCEVYDESNEIEINIHTEDFDYDKSLVVLQYESCIVESNIDCVIEELNLLKDYLELNYNCKIEVKDSLVYLPESI